MVFETEFTFELPKGYIDEGGSLHKHGIMRLSTAADEILPMRDPRIQQNPGYLTIVLLARVITKLGDLKAIDTRMMERLFTTDLTFLQDMYQRINSIEEPTTNAVCPKCGHSFETAINFTNQA